MLTYITKTVTLLMMSVSLLRTPEEAREWLERHGVPVSRWARAHGFEPRVVFALLSGRTRGRWGQAYEAAIALGLRSGPGASEPDPLAVASPRIEGAAAALTNGMREGR